MPTLTARSATTEWQCPPPGTRTSVHNKPNKRGTWEPHGQEGWYLQMTMIHYRCLISYIPNTASEIVSDMTELFLIQKNFPSLSPEDAVTSATADLTEALQNPTPSSYIPHLGYNQTRALRQLASISSTAVPQAPSTHPAQLLRVEKPEPPQPQRITQQPATTVPPEPAPLQRLSEKGKVTMTPGRSPQKPA